MMSRLLFAICILCFMSCSENDINELETFQITETDTSIVETEIEVSVLEKVNNYRISVGLNALEKANAIKESAYNHSQYMLQEMMASHDFFFNRRSRLQMEGAITVSENVAFGFTSASSVVNAWINSESHRVNMEGDYSHFNVSVLRDKETGKHYFTLIFVKK